MKNNWRQLIIVHLSDIHFGPGHQFNPPPDDSGEPQPNLGYPQLRELIAKDLAAGAFADPSAFGLPGSAEPVRVMFAITGDFTQNGSEGEFDEARALLDSIRGSVVLGWNVRPTDIVMVPGNHDVRYTENHTADRWIGYCRFYNDHVERIRDGAPGPSRLRFDEREPHLLSRVIDNSAEGLIVAEINSSAYVRKGPPGKPTASERRGEVDEQSISNLDRALRAISDEARANAIKLALIHHHPVLLPGLAEARRGNDSVQNAKLLEILRDNEFQILLHGHKHIPFAFTYDAECAWVSDRVRPMMILAGGSAGSRDLAREISGACNTYNLISLKWHPEAAQMRVHVETRQLVTQRKTGRRTTELPAPQWHWATLQVDDRILRRPQGSSTSEGGTKRPRNKEDKQFESLRAERISECRRNYPAIEVYPSFHPRQGYEARVWIEGQFDRADYERPLRVEWSAGPMFPDIKMCTAAQDSEFRACFSYYGPMLIQARLFWNDGTHCLGYIFAHYPGK